LDSHHHYIAPFIAGWPLANYGIDVVIQQIQAEIDV